jgi:hypothetical protein
MVLTEKDLKEYQIDNRIKLPDWIVKQLLEKFGTQITDENNNVLEYFEQDIYEQMRKIIQNNLENKRIF